MPSQSQDQSNPVAAAITAVRQHPFTYGFELHLSSGQAAIVFDPTVKAFVLLYDVSRMEDAHWKGDCSTDSALTFNRLLGTVGRAQITLQKIDWRLPNLNTALNHVQVALTSGPEVVEHRTFYSTLDRSGATVEVIRLGPQQAVAPNYLKPAAGFNYKDFQEAGSSFLVSVQVQKDPNGIVLPSPTACPASTISVRILRQEKGQIRQVSEKSIGLPPGNISDSLLRDKIDEFKSKPTIVTSTNPSDPNQVSERVASEIDQALERTLSAYKTGQDPAAVRTILLPLSQAMKANPTGWFLKR